MPTAVGVFGGRRRGESAKCKGALSESTEPTTGLLSRRAHGSGRTQPPSGCTCLRRCLTSNKGGAVKEVRYHVWFEGEPAARSRYFTDEEAARAWARANQPDRRYELW